MTDYARLVVKLEAENAQLKRELDKTTRKLETVDEKAVKAGKSLVNFAKGFVGVFAGSAGIRGFLRMSDTLDKIGKNADKLGVTTDELQRLRFAGEQTGVQFKTIDTSIQRFSRRLGEASKGYGVLKKELDAGGISLKNQDGTMRSVVDVLGDYSNLMAASVDPQEKLRLAVAAFDSEGGALVNTFGNGRRALEQFYKEGENANIFIDEEQIRNSESFNDSLNILNKSVKSFLTTALAPAIPKLTQFFDLLNGKSKDDNSKQGIEKRLDSLRKKLETFNKRANAPDFIKAIFGDTSTTVDTKIRLVKLEIEELTKSLTELDDASKIEAKFAKNIQLQSENARKAAELVGQSIDGLNKKLKEARQLANASNSDINGRLEALKSDRNDSEGGFLDAGLFEVRARNALRSGDLDKALAEAEKGFSILENLKESGQQSGQILGGLGDKLADVIKKANDSKVSKIEAEISINQEKVTSLVETINKASQNILDANPLVQQIITQHAGVNQSTQGVNPALVPNGATQSSQPQPMPTPISITLPNGDTGNFFGDATETNKFKQSIQREALKRGVR